jgi:GDPmannose 4,6-dehydratase
MAEDSVERVFPVARVAFITGITGQDGSYLAELLLSKEYVVYGLKRRQSYINTTRVDHLRGKVQMFYGDMNDAVSLTHILSQIKDAHFVERPGGPPVAQRLEVYNLAAQSHVQISFQMPEYTAESDGLGTLRLLEAIRYLGLSRFTRFYQASTSEMFGLVQETPQRETTPFYPRSPYAAAKLYAHWITKNYREAYGMYTCSGILFNHESPRRGENFVTRKITLGVAKILEHQRLHASTDATSHLSRNERDALEGLDDCLVLGNLDALRDWGHARDYVEGMWRMLQQPEPDDYVLATGEQHSEREFIEKAFALVKMTIRWEGAGADEKGYDAATGRLLVRVSPDFYRPMEVATLLGDATKARTKLGWTHTTGFDQLVHEMVTADLQLICRDKRY